MVFDPADAATTTPPAPLDELLTAALVAEGFDETDTEHAVAAVLVTVRAYGTAKYQRGLGAGDYFARQSVAHRLGLGELRS